MITSSLFASNEVSNNLFEHTHLSEWSSYFWSGVIAGTLSLIVNVPMEVCKVRAQTKESGFVSYRKAIPSIYEKQGVPGFY